MKIIIISFILILIIIVPVFCGGIRDKEPVNTREIEINNIDEIEIQYRSEDIVILNNNSDKLILKEFMTDNNSEYFAKITNSGNKLSIEAGRRPAFNARFKVSIEVYIPVSKKNFTIKTSSGKIDAAGEYTASSMSLETSSGDIQVNSITADRINLKTSSGGVNCRNVNGNSAIETSSGSIVCSVVNGDSIIKSSSGKIELDKVSGSLNAAARSGSIRSGKIGGKADIRTSSGDITVNEINGSAVFEASSGSVYCLAGEGEKNITITTSSGNVVLDIPRNFVFNFSSRSSSGSLKTPFPDKLFNPVSDKDHIQGVIGNDNSSKNQINNNISIKTNSGSIKVNWSN
jgi:DUF4097 and DUF4098 domain-containing protein YvlB